jgi:antitoxin ParD1/3/4
MPTRNVNLTEELDRFVAAKISSGKYESASEVIRAGLRALEERDEARAEWLAYLRSETVQGFTELDRGEGLRLTPDELLAGIDEELDRGAELSQTAVK